MPNNKNIVICADGTWNRPENDLDKDHPTNVLKLSRAISPRKNVLQQVVFYDWGLGSYHGGMSAGAFGKGIHKNILDAYRFIVQNYKPNDRIYLFGFSRGAYTVRALSGLINNCGILKKENARHIVDAWKIYKSPARKNHPSTGENAIAFREKSHTSRKIQFIGVWDTVGALGIPFSVMGLFEAHDEFYDTKMGSNVVMARHALAIDERREDFEPTVWSPRSGVDLEQVWFSGVHADIGGSYPPDKSGKLTSDIALHWMLSEAAGAGLGVEQYLKQSVDPQPDASLNKSRTKVFRLRPAKPRSLSPLDPKSGEPIPVKIHRSVKARYENDPSYRPKNLTEYLAANGGWPDDPG